MKIIKIIFLISFLNIFLSSCLQKSHSGYSFESIDFNRAAVNRSTKRDVFAIMGSPSFISNIGNEVWVYHSEKHTNRAFFKKNITESKTVAFAFNNRGILTNVKSYDLQDRKNIKIEQDYTKVKGKEVSGIKQILGNIGRMSSEKAQGDIGN